MNIIAESTNGMALAAIQNDLTMIRDELRHFAQDGGHWCAWLPSNIRYQEAYLRTKEKRLHEEFISLRDSDQAA